MIPHFVVIAPKPLEWTTLDSQNLVYHFLFDYYDLKSTNGPREWFDGDGSQNWILWSSRDENGMLLEGDDCYKRTTSFGLDC